MRSTERSLHGENARVGRALNLPQRSSRQMAPMSAQYGSVMVSHKLYRDGLSLAQVAVY
jgi:hypothetical protein